MGKSYKVWQKNVAPGPYSVLLEQRNRAEALLFESLVIAALGKKRIIDPNMFFYLDRADGLTFFSQALQRLTLSRNHTLSSWMLMAALVYC